MFRGSSFQPWSILSEQKSITGQLRHPKNEKRKTKRLTSKVRVVVLDVSAASLIQDLQFLLASLGNVGKVLVIGAVHTLRVGFAFLVPQVVPVRSGKGDLQVLDLLGGHKAGKEFELFDIGATNVLDLARADHTLTGLVALLDERSNVGGIVTEIIHIDIRDLLESLKTREEGAPEH